MKRAVCVMMLGGLLIGCGGGNGGGSNEDPPAQNNIVVELGDDEVIALTDSLALTATVTGVVQSATYQWSKVAGPGTANFSDDAVEDPSVSFSAIGSYTLGLTVSENGSSMSDSIEVTVNRSFTDTSGLTTRPTNTTQCVAPDEPPAVSSIQLENPFPNLPSLSSPLAMYMAPGDDTHWYVVQRGGQVLKFANQASVDTVATFVNINDSRLVSGGELGLLGMAFHPNFSTNGYVYLSYTSNEGGRHSRISRFELDGTEQALDAASEQIILTVDQPYGNHNGGQIMFGPDGYLYIGMGDGGSGGDPLGHGQNVNTLLGAILRIDVGDGSSGTYTIPAGNPFALGGGAAEIFAYGLRNPWRWSFDRDTGDLWAGDVGQGAYEEIDIITAGGNYGWNIMEGAHCYNASSCDQSGLTLPVTEYGRSQGYSVTGGYVYRGSDIAFLAGQYIYGDYGSGIIWALEETMPDQYDSTELIDTSLNIASFAEDHNGELYVIGLGGQIRRIAGAAGGGGNVPENLSGWGCFDGADTTAFSEHVIPFDINALLWTDNADKGRFIAIPDGTTIDVDSEGRFDFPVGSILGKHFWLDGDLIETRLLLHHTQPHGWKGYSYEWNDGQTEASLLSGAKDKDFSGTLWHYPSQAECDACHTSVVGFTVGPELGQLNRNYTYPTTTEANQLETLDQLNIFTTSLSTADKETFFYAIDDTAYSPALRARSYLHSNCASCHQPGGTGGGTMDLRMGTSFANTQTCNAAPAGDDMGLTTPAIITPGEPDQSILVLRMEDTGEHRMPPLGTHIIDTEAVTVIRAWIDGLSGCP